MVYGDRIYARLSVRGNKILEFMAESVGSMTELLGELRAQARKLRGLCKLYVRNMTRGWSFERPLMLYPERYPTSTGWRERLFDDAETTGPTTTTAPAATLSAARPRILNPWDTH